MTTQPGGYMPKQTENQQQQFFGFDKDENVKNILLRDLAKTVRVEGKFGRMLQTRPVQSWTLISTVMSFLEKEEINHHVKNIYVQKKSSYPRINDSDKVLGYNRENCPLQKWEFDKIMTAIDIPNLGNDLATGSIAISFDDRGMTLAFGMNVHVCSNFSILGGNVMRTFKQGGREAMSWESMRAILAEWIRERQQIIGVEMEIMKRMMDRKIQDETVISRVVGDLYQKAIDQAYFSKQFAPFDTHGMSQFVQEMFKQRKQQDTIGSVWDLYNWGTEILKPGKVDTSDIIESSKTYADYLCLEFGIEREDLFTEAEEVQ